MVGKRQDLKLAQALDKDSEIIFADEPTSNLDIDGIRLLERKTE